MDRIFFPLAEQPSIYPNTLGVFLKPHQFSLGGFGHDAHAYCVEKPEDSLLDLSKPLLHGGDFGRFLVLLRCYALG